MENRLEQHMEFQEITSRKSALVREAAKPGEGLFLAEGARLCRDAAESGIEILQMLFTQAAREKYPDYLQAIAEVCNARYQIAGHVAPLLAETKNTQGVFCLCRIPKEENAALSGKILVLEGLQDPANLGAILRTAEALGIARVLLLGSGANPYGGKALRASMGAVFRMRPVWIPRRAALFSMLREAGIKTFAAVPRNGRDFSVPFPENAAVLVGNEGNGLTPETIAACDACTTIPMQGRAESLGAAAAAGIIMWEMMRGSGQTPTTFG